MLSMSGDIRFVLSYPLVSFVRIGYSMFCVGYVIYTRERSSRVYISYQTKNMVYTTFTNFSMKYLVMCKVYTDVGGIKELYHVCPPVRKIIHSLKLVDYLHVQADNPWYNYYITYLALTQPFPMLISYPEMYTLCSILLQYI